jgi:uncharacterized protein YcfJ
LVTDVKVPENYRCAKLLRLLYLSAMAFGSVGTKLVSMRVLRKENGMKHNLRNHGVLAVAVLASGLCAAQEVGRVLSSTPVMQQVAVPRQICSNQAVVVPNQRSGAGAAIGALAGGALGNAVGHGGGRAVATILGLFGGAVVGDRVEGQGSQVQNVQSCTTQSLYENRLVNYNVVYEYAGKQYSVQMPYDPGPTIQIQVTPVGSNPVQDLAPLSYVQPPVTQTVYAQPVIVTSEPVYYPGYYPRPYSPPIGVNLQLGYGGGYYGGGHGHWR